MRKIVILLMLIIVGAGCTTAGPRYALSRLREAILNHDPDAAFHYIDIDRVVDSLVETGLARREARSDAEALGIDLGKRVMPLMLPALRKFTRDQLRIAITSSDETGYFSSIRKASVWYLNIDSEGDRAVVTPKGSKKAAFRMAKTPEGSWKIIEIMPEGQSAAAPIGPGHRAGPAPGH